MIREERHDALMLRSLQDFVRRALLVNLALGQEDHISARVFARSGSMS